MKLGTCMAALKWWLGSARQLRRGWFWNVWRKTERSKMRLEKGGRAQGEGSSFGGEFGEEKEKDREKRRTLWL